MIAFVLMLLSLNDLYAENRIGADFALNIPEEIFLKINQKYKILKSINNTFIKLNRFSILLL